MGKRNDEVPEWAKPGLDDPDAYDPPKFRPAGPVKEAPRHVVGCRCMTCALIRLRAVLRSEAPLQVNSRAAPVLRDFEGIPERETDEGGVGLPFTASFHRYLSGPDSWGVTRLGMLSIVAVSEMCASKHPTHRRAMFERTVCGQLTFEAGYLGQDLEDLAWLHREATEGMPVLSPDMIRGLLEWSLRLAEDWRADRFARWTKVPGGEEPLPERRRVA